MRRRFSCASRSQNPAVRPGPASCQCRIAMNDPGRRGNLFRNEAVLLKARQRPIESFAASGAPSVRPPGTPRLWRGCIPASARPARRGLLPTDSDLAPQLRRTQRNSRSFTSVVKRLAPQAPSPVSVRSLAFSRWASDSKNSVQHHPMVPLPRLSSSLGVVQRAARSLRSHDAIGLASRPAPLRHHVFRSADSGFSQGHRHQVPL
jgi:hypothetical protein